MNSPERDAPTPTDSPTTELLEAEHAGAERLVNGVRAVALLLLAGAALVYARHLTRPLTIVNAGVLAPMLLWTLLQHVRYRRRPLPAGLSTVNALVDILAVTALLFGYGLVGQPELAVKSPIWVAYFVILAARPFTTSARNAALTAVAAVGAYAAVAGYFIADGHLVLHAGPLETVAAGGTSLADEGSKLLLLAIAGAVSTYATGWTERTLRRATRALRGTEAELRGLLAAMSDIIVVLDADGRYRRVVPSAADPRFRPPPDLVGRRVHDLLAASDADAIVAAARRALDARHATHVEYRVDSADRSAWFAATLSPNAPDTVVCVARDITERRTLEEQLVHQAFHDSLTGLANRALFRDRLQHALAGAERHPPHVAVLFLDIDDFKATNDSLGHGHGDQLLAAAALRISSATREGDTVARLGGDEFAVLLEHVPDAAGAAAVAERILDALRQPVLVSSRPTTIAASIGIAHSAAGTAEDELLRNADLAMYAAKSRGKGRCMLFAPEMLSVLVDRLALEADLARALEREEFRLAYQPIIQLESGRPVGAEALVRWDHPERGLLGPGAFIPVAEETGAIVALGRWVLGEACREAARWQRGGAPGFTVTVNLSARQLEDGSLVADVSAALRDSGLDPTCLVLEITESVLMRDAASAAAILRDVRALGVRLAVDDFGTGYSSLAYLQHFPISIIKIDRSFVAGLTQGGNDAALARTIVALGGTLSLTTVAEGIEEAEQETRLRELGCELGQGYLFARPLAASQLAALLAGPVPLRAADTAGIAG